jgi:hypothetical protein
MNIYVFFGLVQILLFVAKLSIQICMDKDNSVSLIDILLGKYFNISLFLPIKRSDENKHFYKYVNYLVFIFYLNFILLAFYFTFII